jgi:nitrite reductase/ring-hydroxylating ferredoxin subunit
MTQAVRPGQWVEPDSGIGLGIEDVGAGTFNMRISTDRYTSRECAQLERDRIWMRVWQIVGRVNELPKTGDWKQYRILDQSFVIVRGRDEKLRGFVNACRHRGNILCNAPTGNAKRGFLCQYHLWSYDLQGKLRGVLRENLAGQINKSENSLLEVSTRSAASFSSTRTRMRSRSTSSLARRWPNCSRRTTSTTWSP